MDSCIVRPALPDAALISNTNRLLCLVSAVALHLVVLGAIYVTRPAAITPPLPLTLSARWVGESSANDAPTKPAAPAPVPAQTKAPAPAPVQKPQPPRPATDQKRVVKQTVREQPKRAPAKPTPHPVRPLTASNPLPPAKTAAVMPTPAVATSAAGAAPERSNSTTPPRQQDAGASAPIARDARLHNPEPSYPPESRRRGEEGRVLLKVRVSKEGAAESVEVAQSSGYRRLDMAARKTVSRWRFIPARQEGTAIAAWTGVTIIFKLGK